MISNFKKALLISTTIGILSGCSISAPKENQFQENSFSAEDAVKKVNGDYVSAMEQTEELQESVYQLIELERNDLPSKLVAKKVDLKTSDKSTVGEMLSNFAEQEGMGIVNALSTDANDRLAHLNFKGALLENVIKSIERSMNIDISIKNNTLYAADKMIINGNFPIMETETSKVYENLKGYLSKVLGENSQIIIDSQTGSFLIKSEPNKMRMSKKLIENMINESFAHALIKFYVYKIDNKRAKEFGVSVSALVNGLSEVSAGGAVTGSPILSIFGKEESYKTLADGTKTLQNSLMASIKALEEREIVHSVSTPSITMFNGIEAKIDETSEVGDFVPGQITETTTTVNGVYVRDLREAKPTFDMYEVGNKLTLKGRINRQEKVVQLKIDYEETKLYGTETTTWMRSQDNIINLSRKLKNKNVIDTMAMLYDGDYTVISGNKQQSGYISSANIPGVNGTPLDNVGNKNNESTFHDILIIAKPIFPKGNRYSMIENTPPHGDF